jgi:aspartate racemase
MTASPRTHQRTSRGKSTRPLVLGIAGGLGPAATARLYRSIVSHITVLAPRAYPRIVIESVPIEREVECAFVQGQETRTHAARAREHLRAAIGHLQIAGAEILALPCNTLQEMFLELCVELNATSVDMVGATLNAVDQRGCRRPLLLATESTYERGLYSRVAMLRGGTLVHPDDEQRRAIATCIDEVLGRASDHQSRKNAELVVKRIVESMDGQIDGIILGCTDLSFLDKSFDRCAVDSLEALADACASACCVDSLSDSHDHG